MQHPALGVRQPAPHAVVVTSQRILEALDAHGTLGADGFGGGELVTSACYYLGSLLVLGTTRGIMYWKMMRQLLAP